MLFLPAARIQFGGMSNVLLFLSVLVMVLVIGRQMLKLDRSRRDSLSLDDAVRWLSKFGLLFLFLLTSFVALHFFNTTMADVLVSAAESRTFNKDCIFMGTFDAHDVWHMSMLVRRPEVFYPCMHACSRSQFALLYVQSSTVLLQSEPHESGSNSRGQPFRLPCGFKCCLGCVSEYGDATANATDARARLLFRSSHRKQHRLDDSSEKAAAEKVVRDKREGSR